MFSAQTLKKILTTGAALALLAMLCAAFLLNNASAQQATRILTIVPPQKEFVVNPGDRQEGELKLINDSDTTLTFTASAQDFIVEDTHGTPNVLPAGTLTKRFSAASWIGLIPDTFTIAPHQRQTIQFYLQIPADARPGGHYAAIVYNPTETIGVKGTGTAVQTQLGTLFSIDVKGNISELAIVTNFSTNPFQEYGPVHIMTQIRNYGDLHIKPKGSIVITNIFGQQVATLPLDEHNIFPTAARDYINIFDKKLMIGRYTAKFLALYGEKNNLPLEATVSFIVFPWKVALIITLILVAIILGIFVYKRRNEIKAWEEHMRVHHPEQ